MKHLPTVTLIACDGQFPDRTARVLNHCARLFAFADVRLISPVKPTIPFEHTWICRDTDTYAKAMAYEAHGLIGDVHTPHCLYVSHDGWILNPHLWRDEWLSLDMIGAAWPAHWGTGHRVGNTGFCLRSRRFLRLVASARELYAGQPADVFACRALRRPLEEAGMRFATVAQAGVFSWEHPLADAECGPGVSFGFHGWVAGKAPENFIPLLDR